MISRFGMRLLCRQVAANRALTKPILPARERDTAMNGVIGLSASPQQIRGIMAQTFYPSKPPQEQTFKLIEERVLKAIKAWDRFPQDRADKLNLDADFANDLGLDSLDHVEMMMAIESEFNAEFDLDTAEAFTSPRKIYDYMCQHYDVYK